MPAYDNSIAVTSQTTEIISRLNIPYVSISLIPNIPHIHQLEIERVFTFDRDGSAETVNNFLKDKNVAIEDKRKLFLIPSNYITYNENTKTIDIDDLAVNQYDYVTTNPPYIIKVPPIVAGEDVIIRRKTISNTPLVIYSAGTKLTSNQLNLETTQLIYLIQEVLDRVYYQMLLNGDVVADVADNTVYTNALQESAVTTSKIANLSITNDKISTGQITYDKINTTTSPWAVDLYTDQAITGIKTLTHAIFSDSLKINYGVPEQQQGTQYVLAYNGDGNGGVEWQLNDPWETVPSTIVQTGNNQTISGNKTFGGSTTTTFDGTVKFTQSPTAGKALVSSDSNGTASWQSVVNSIKLGGSTASTSTGEVVITPDSIGALSSSGGTVTGAVTFQDSVNLGDAIQDNVEIRGTFKIRPNDTNPTTGYMLQAGSGGTMSFVDPNSVLSYVKTINGKTGNTVDLVASDLNALSTTETTQQSLAGPITFNNDVTLGNSTTDNINIEGTLKYLPGVVGTGQAGKVLTSTSTGEVVWQDIPPTGLESLTLGSNATQNNVKNVIITADSINAASLDTAQNITGLKTLTNGLNITGGQLTYNVGSNLNGKVLTANANGNASWQDTKITGITTLTMGGTDYSGQTVSVTPERIQALSTTTNTTQSVAGQVNFDGNVTLGNANTDLTVINSSLQYTNGVTGTGQAGKVLTSDGSGNVVWQTLPPTGLASLTLGSNATQNNVKDVTITAASIGAVSTNTNENISGIKTFTNGLTISGGQLNYNVGSDLTGKVLTSDSSGNASWQTPAATGITSITLGGQSYSTPNVTITADSINAIASNTNSTITGDKTFTGSVTLGDSTDDLISISGQLKYTPNGVVPTNGLVLMSTPSGNAIWQTPDTTGFITPSTIGSYIPEISTYYADINNQLPKASTSQYGVVQLDQNGGLEIQNNKLRINPNYGTLPIATATQLGGIKIGSGLTINSTTGVVSVDGYTPGSTSVNSFNTRTGAVTPSDTDYTAVPGQSNSVIDAVDLSSSQNITGSKTFKAVQIVTSDTTSGVGGSGKKGIELNTSGLLKAQRATSTDKIFEGYSSSGGNTSWIKGDGNAYFEGLVEANGGFKTDAGVTLGATAADSLILSGTVKIIPNKTTDYVLTCTNGNDGTAEWRPSPTAPVSSVNGLTGAVKIRTDNLYNAAGTAFVTPVTISENQTITANKQFDGTANFTNNVTIGNANTDILTINALPKIPLNAAVGKLLVCSNADGSAGWQDKTIVSSVNNIAPENGNVTISLSNLNGAATNASNTFSAAQTFSNNLIVQGTTTLGDSLTDDITINGVLKYQAGTGGNGKYLTCTNNDGTLSLTSLPNFVKTINSSSPDANGNFAISTSTLGAVDISSAQTITGNKTFTGASTTIGDAGTDILTIQATPKIVPNAAVGRLLVCTNADGTATWQTKNFVTSVNSITPVDGNVTISLSNLNGAATNASNTFSAAQTFSNNVTVTGNTTLGDSLSDKLVISSTLRIPTGAGLGKYLSCTLNTTGNEGTVGWSDLPLFVKTINSSTPDTNGNFNITASTLGVVDTTTAQNIAGNKTFTGSTTFDGNLTANGNITLGNTTGDIITIVGTLKGSGLGSVGNGKVLTSDSDGNIGLQNPIMQGVKGNNETSFRTGNVNLTAANIGAASTTDLNTTNANVTAAQTTANSALSAANTAQTTADGKLSSISTTTTTLGGNAITTLDGNGTAANPLKVLRAEPAGPAGGDLAGNYPNPTIKDSSVTFAKMQNINTNRLLGRKDSSTGNIQEIQLGSGLQFNESTGVLDCTVVGGSSLLGGGTFAIPQVWGGYNNFSNVTNFESTLNALGDLTVSGALSIEGNLAINSNKFNVNSSNGNTTVGGTLGVTGATTMGSVTASSLSLNTDLAIADGGTGASTASAARTNLGLVIGTNVQAYNAGLNAISALGKDDGNFIVGNGSTWVAESGSTARTSLGLGTMATQESNNVSITGGSISGITDLGVAHGGTGASTASAARTNLGLNPVLTTVVEHTHNTSLNTSIDVTGLPIGVPTIYRQRTSASSGGQAVTANNYITFSLAAGEAIQYEVYHFISAADFPTRIETTSVLRQLSGNWQFESQTPTNSSVFPNTDIRLTKGTAFGSQNLQLGRLFSSQYYSYCWVMAIVTRLS